MQVLEAGKTTIYSLAFTPEGEVVVGTKNGQALILDANAVHRVLYCYAGQPEAAESFSIFSIKINQNNLAAVGMVAGCALINVNDNSLQSIRTQTSFLGVEFLDDNTLLLAEGDRPLDGPGGFQMWKMAPSLLRLEPRFKDPKGARAVAAHSQSRVVAWATGHKKVTVWNTLRQDPLHIPLPHTATALAFHPDGDRIAFTQDWTIELYDINKQYEVASFEGHKGRVTSVAFSLDGRVLATGSWDKTVRLWNVENGKLIAAYEGPTGKVFTLAYAPDGMRLAAAGDAGNVVLWDVE